MAHSIPSALPLPKGFVKCWNLLSLSTSRQERTKLFNPCQNLSIPIIFARFISSYRKTEIAPFLGKNQTSQKVVWSPNFRDTNEFATETKQSLSNVSLCVFKIARWLKRACNILDRSHVLIRLAVEKDLSPVALIAGLTWFNLQTEQQWRCWSTVARLAADLGLPSKFPESNVKGLPAWALEMYLIAQQGRWYWHRRWTSMANRLPLFLNVYFCLKLAELKPPPTPQPPRLRRPCCSCCG